ncbi:hypothetical protein J6590_042842 [Homalodisca vitripennis]|nr:hypothetical protein J6590_042842 [Homalodisca vitripennis]
MARDQRDLAQSMTDRRGPAARVSPLTACQRRTETKGVRLTSCPVHAGFLRVPARRVLNICRTVVVARVNASHLVMLSFLLCQSSCLLGN